MKGLALLLINLPGALAIAGGVSFYLSNRSSGFITVAGEKRGYVLHVPPPRVHDPARPAPLVISLHGAGLWGAAQRDISGWNAIADREGFIVAYPSGGGGGRGSPRVWRVNPGPGMARDVEFIARLIDTLSARYNVDRERVYVNGLSNGGGMSFVLSCVLADRIAAVGVVSTALSMRRTACPEQRAVPVIVFHGAADPVTPYAGGKAWVAPRAFPSVPAWVQSWAERNRCAPAPRDSLVAASVSRRAYARCADGADVVLYTLHGAGHVWPGGMPLPRWLVGGAEDAVDASREMWAFFRERRLSR